MNSQAKIIEIFSSIQGEGEWVGKSQVFVRFHGCSLKCNYCDTPLTHHKIQNSRIERKPYTKEFETNSLIYSPQELNQIIDSFNIPSLAITGGEPLEQSQFLKSWLPHVSKNYEILLETSGTYYQEVRDLAEYIDMISFDIKLPSSSGEKDYFEEHQKFIDEIELDQAYGKVVYDETITPDEIENLIQLLTNNPELKIYFQPVSPLRQRDIKKCMKIFHDFSLLFHSQVKLVPQIHKFLSVM